MAKETFTNLDKIFWPKEKYTKGDLIAYYKRVARVILPYLKDRPIALNRYPDGIKGVHFFQKNVTDKLPSFVETVTLKAKTTGKKVKYVLCNNKETLLYLANYGNIELNPWNSRRHTLTKPDWMIFDLDPGSRSSFADVVAVARELHTILSKARIPNFCKTSGKRGLHVYVPLGAHYSYDVVRTHAHALAEEVVAKLPKIASLEHWPAKRRTKVYIDIMRNAIAQTAVAPYTVRPVSGAPVSTPLSWSEVKRGLDPTKFTIRTMGKRLAQRGDLWKKVMGKRATLR